MIDISDYFVIIIIFITAADFGTFMIIFCSRFAATPIFQILQNVRRLGEQVSLVVRVAVASVTTGVV